ncbi:hypothetical protein e1116g03.tmp0041 [Eimeria tenella]|uniref:Uncharacterized protein n=1 Tax=Eimeria tenella TaxID=5802 RepID=C8TE36_EIMTE|nr:hypothetical protein e1116g03.tmp0041 [Eimeria tenella]
MKRSYNYVLHMYSLGLASWRIVRADEERYRLLRKIYTDNKTYRGTRTHLLSKACQKSKAIPHRLRQQYASLSFQINKHDLHKSLTNILRHEIINVNMLVNMLVPHILPAISWKPLSAHNSQQTLINYITLRLNRHTLTLHLNHPDIIGQRQREIARREAGGTPKFQQRLLEPLPNQADGQMELVRCMPKHDVASRRVCSDQEGYLEIEQSQQRSTLILHAHDMLCNNYDIRYTSLETMNVDPGFQRVDVLCSSNARSDVFAGMLIANPSTHCRNAKPFEPPSIHKQTRAGQRQSTGYSLVGATMRAPPAYSAEILEGFQYFRCHSKKHLLNIPAAEGRYGMFTLRLSRLYRDTHPLLGIERLRQLRSIQPPLRNRLWFTVLTLHEFSSDLGYCLFYQTRKRANKIEKA